VREQADHVALRNAARAASLSQPPRSRRNGRAFCERLPHLGAHDVAEIDREVRAALGEIEGHK
jgi:hypothetical protein